MIQPQKAICDRSLFAFTKSDPKQGYPKDISGSMAMLPLHEAHTQQTVRDGDNGGPGYCFLISMDLPTPSVVHGSFITACFGATMAPVGPTECRRILPYSSPS